ncbi:hypothetical protein RQN30_08210 [Arcanobacterium hippocoleae]
MLRTQIRRKHFLHSLAAQNPDLIVLTGDLISENGAITHLLAALESFRGIPGVYVFGSNDYHAPRPKNPFSYLFKNSNLSKAKPVRRLETDRLIAGLDNLGFLNLNNAAGSISVGDWDLEFAGVDDPHIGLAKYPRLDFPKSSADISQQHLDETGVSNAAAESAEPAGFAEPARSAGSAGSANSAGFTAPAGSANSANSAGFAKPITQTAKIKNTARQRVRIGLTHAPYKDVLDWMQNAGCQIVFAGHTHGGQVCLPGHRALVTNCDIPTSHASGLFSWPLYTGEDKKLRAKIFRCSTTELLLAGVRKIGARKIASGKITIELRNPITGHTIFLPTGKNACADICRNRHFSFRANPHILPARGNSNRYYSDLN